MLRAALAGGAPERAPRLGAAAFDSAVDVTLSRGARDARRLGCSLSTGTRLLNTTADRAGGARPEARAAKPARDFRRKYADLAMDGQARLEIRTDRVREGAMQPRALGGSELRLPRVFRAPSLDNQVNIRSTGILGRRVHVNVDFDTERDYSSNNDVQIYYEGLEDEIVRRVDVGTVNFQPPPSPLHHRRGSRQQLRRQRGLRSRADPAPDPRRHPEGQRRWPSGPTPSARPPARPQDRQVRDLDFESGRFFWVVDPDSVPGTPAVDILELDPTVAAGHLPPDQVRVYRYRAARGNSGVNPNLGGITALGAHAATAPEPLAPVRWELLIQGTDYYLDGSGLWVVLGTKLDQNDYLAVSFRTAAGTHGRHLSRGGPGPRLDRQSSS